PLQSPCRAPPLPGDEPPALPTRARESPASRWGPVPGPLALARAAHAVPDTASLRDVRRADEPVDGPPSVARRRRGTSAVRASVPIGSMTVFARLVERVAEQRRDLSFTVEFWDGSRRAYGVRPDDLVIRLKDRKTCLGLLADPSTRFGDAYADGAIEIEGDLGKLMEFLLRIDPRDLAATRRRQLLAAATSRLLRNSPFRARRNVRYHYDLGNEFFRLWLGRTMAYSCAYFRDPADDIDTAQEQKFQHVCEKLRLEPGLTLLDIGCGWGGLAAYAATHYGVRVTGITLSEAQRRGADEMLRTRDLDSRVAIRLQDYRELKPDRPFDRIVSIGMFEHVGRRLIPRYLRETARLLAPGGVGLLHTIGRVKPASMDAWIVARVFPGAYFPALAEIVAPMGAHGLHPTDV